MAAVNRVGRAIDSALKPEVMNLITSAGKVAEQTVPHLHLHVVPRWQRDDFGSIWPIEGKKYEDAELEDVAAALLANPQSGRESAGKAVCLSVRRLELPALLSMGQKPRCRYTCAYRKSNDEHGREIGAPR